MFDLLKRIVAFAVLIIFLPLFSILSILILIQSGLPIIFSQYRIGLYDKIFSRVSYVLWHAVLYDSA